MKKELLQALPSVEILINEPEILQLVAQHGREVVLKACRICMERAREALRTGQVAEPPEKDQVSRWIAGRIVRYVTDRYSRSLRKAINATGVVLHTGLGRAVLSEAAVRALDEIIDGYCTLATSVETGRRGHRDDHLNGLLCELTGAEAATVVCNNAAATMVILNSLAKGKEVIISRGQLVEIGGAFRIPEVMETSGATLRDVGTTNKTHLRDYENAICEETGALMRVHHSNYRILGFSSEPGVKEMVALAHDKGLCLIDDIGSGALVELNQYGLENEPLIKDSIEVGADAICFSGDKLIGGPQAGIIVGKAEVIKKISKNPLTRACRVGKLTIAALEATLKLFLKPDELNTAHPTYRMFSAQVPALSRRAHKMKRALRGAIASGADIRVADGHSQVGSGSVPVETIPSKLLVIKPAVLQPEVLAQKLRYGRPAVFTRVHKESVMVDFRTVHPSEDKYVLEALTAVLGQADRPADNDE